MILAVDSETTGTDFYHGCRAFMVTACDGATNYWWQGQVNPYTREVYWNPDDIEDIYDLLCRAKEIIYHNAKFDITALSYMGLPMEQFWVKTHDTIIAAHCLNAAHDTYEDKKAKKLVGRSLGLKPLALEYFGYPSNDEEALERAVKAARDAAPPEYRIAKQGDPCFPGQKNQKWYKMDYWLAPEECLKYGLGDVERTYLLWSAFKNGLISDNLWNVYRKRLRLLRNCYSMTKEGEDFNSQAAATYIEELKVQKEDARQAIKKSVGINWAFTPSKAAHIAALVRNYSGIGESGLIYTEKGGVATDKLAMAIYEKTSPHPMFELIRTWKTLDARSRYIKSYYNWVANDGRIHSNFNPTGTRETRQSSDSPNSQNRTAILDRFFHPEKGWIWWDADFENIEMRIWAYAVNNPELVEMFNEGRSYHMFIFNELFPNEAAKYKLVKDKPKSEMNEYELRLAKRYRDIKAFNFGIIYGATERKADETVGVQGCYRKVITRIPEIEQFTRSLVDQMYYNLEKCDIPSIYTLGGYRLPVPVDEPYKACNYYVQGSAGIVTMDAMDAIASDDDYKDSNSRMYNQTHDSIRIKIPICQETEYLIDRYKFLMEEAGRQYIPSCGVTYNIITHPEEAWPF